MKQHSYGYVRVSAKDQNEARQMDALMKFSVPKENIFVDKKSGKDFSRPAWSRLIKNKAGRSGGGKIH